MGSKVLGVLVAILAFVHLSSADLCHDSGYFSVICESSKVLQKLINSESPIVILPGLEIVSVANATRNATGRSNDGENEDTSIVGRIAGYLKKREINIKFSQFLDGNEFRNILNNMDSSKDVTGRKKDKGYGIILAMGLMMAKVLGVLGMGGIGALAMKALGVSVLALLLSGILGIKSLHSGHEESGHHVQYIHDGHHRKRRDNNQGREPLPYRGWKSYRRK